MQARAGAYRLLAPPVPCAELDFCAADVEAALAAREARLAFEAGEDGVLNGVAFWFELDLVDELRFGTAPGGGRRQRVQWVDPVRAATRIGAPFATRTGSTHWTRCRRPPPGAVPKRSSSTKSSSNQNATPFRTPSSPASNARRASRAASAASTSAAQKSSSAQGTGGARSRYAPARACIEPSRSSSSDPGPHRYRSSAARGTPCDAGSGAQKTRARAGTTTHSGTARWRRAWRT